MSPAVIEAYAAELPKLEAHESLRRMTEIAVGTGSVKPEESRRIVRSWEGQADREPPRRTFADLRAAADMGIEVVKDG